ncbi:unnamed protein product, partial [Ixodes pacificus]
LRNCVPHLSFKNKKNKKERGRASLPGALGPRDRRRRAPPNRRTVRHADTINYGRKNEGAKEEQKEERAPEGRRREEKKSAKTEGPRETPNCRSTT